MRLIISARSASPVYEQIVSQIVSQILNGELKPDEMLPSIRTVSKETGVSVITVKNAYEKLEVEGFIYTLPAKGSYVKQRTETLKSVKLSLAEKRFLKDADYYKSLGVTKEELKKIIDENY